MFHFRRRAIWTAIFIFLTIIANTGIYFWQQHQIQTQVVITEVWSKVDSQGSFYGSSASSPLGPNGKATYRPGDRFGVIVNVRGNGTIENLSISPSGFSSVTISPTLPIKLTNASRPATLGVEITITRCCYRGPVYLDFTGS